MVNTVLLPEKIQKVRFHTFYTLLFLKPSLSLCIVPEQKKCIGVRNKCQSVDVL